MALRIKGGNAPKRPFNRLAAWCGWEGMQVEQGGRSHGLTDYSIYRLSRSEFSISVIVGCAMVYAGIYLFYQSAAVSCIAALLGAAAPRFRRRYLLLRRRNRLKLQFKEALFSLTSSLAAGRSLENAFRTALDDLKLLYTDPAAHILQEFQIISHRLDNAEPLELALRDLANRAGIDEITQFVDALSTCKRSGGDLLEVMRRTSTIIGEKLGVEGEIMVMIAQKKFEARIMMAVPFVFLGFLGYAAPEYMEPLYNGPGYVVVTAALVMLLGCYWAMHYIMNIEM